MARRTNATDTTTATAIDRLVRSRADGLYELGAKLQDLASARAAVAAAAERERAVLAEAVALQERLLADRWKRAELQEVGLWVEPPAAPRRRRGRPTTALAADAAPADSGPSDPAPPALPDSTTGAVSGAVSSVDSSSEPVGDQPVPVG